jgi:6-hydroxycyclohex-1-ene-1-carbonyl-CoA dehydrogenase
MPGNQHDGGFANLVQVPARGLCPVPALPPGLDLWQLGVGADAGTTAYQALRRVHARPGEVCLIVGVGGVGGFLGELAVAGGAVAVALDVDPARLERAASHGSRLVRDVRDADPKALRKDLARELLRVGVASEGWHVFECSGTQAGQALAYGLLNRGATLSVVGYAPGKIEISLSNLMALDAKAFGNWGCDPEHFGAVLDLVVRGKVDLQSAVARFPLSKAPEVLAAAHRGQLARRPVLVPDA